MKLGLTCEQLRTLVPRHLEVLSSVDTSALLPQAEQAADVIASGLDVLWMTPRQRRVAECQPDEVIGAIGRGVAILARRPGGVWFGGLHWSADEPLGEGQWTLPAEVDDGRARGAVFTPRSLAEQVTNGALEPLVYSPGPLDTEDVSQWVLVPSTRIIGLRIGDIAVGSGVFPIAAVRYLAARLANAWQAELGVAPTPAVLAAARQLTIRCVHAVDVDPMSVEVARLAVALLAPTIDLDLTGQIVLGDSLIGIRAWEQIASMSIRLDAEIVFEPVEIAAMITMHQAGDPRPGILADLVSGFELHAASGSAKKRRAARATAIDAARHALESRDGQLAARRLAREWLDTDLPDGQAPRRPLHYPLTWPNVFTVAPTRGGLR